MDTKFSVLIIDESAGIRQALKGFLNSIGIHEIRETHSGLEALQLIQQEAPNLVIATWNSQGMSGLGLLRWLRSLPRYAHIPFLMLSEGTDPELAYSVAENPLADYLEKPFSTKSLVTKLSRLLSREIPIPDHINEDNVIGLNNAEELEKRLDGARILVIDDMQINSEVIVEILKTRYTVDVAYSGSEGLKLAQSATPPHLILLDVIMPEMDGYEVCKQLKLNLATRAIPIIFLSGQDEVSDVVRGFEVGGVDYITKPAEPSILHARIQTHLRLKFAFSDLAQQNASITRSVRLKEDVEQMTQQDLKTPLCSIISHTDHLLKEDLPNDLHKAYVTKIQASAWRTLNLVNQSMSLYQIEMGTFSLKAESVDIAAILVMIRSEMASQLIKNRIDVRLSTKDGSKIAPGHYLGIGEKGLCYSLFTNLIKAIAEVTKEGGLIEATLSIDRNYTVISIESPAILSPIHQKNFFSKNPHDKPAHARSISAYTAKLLTQAQRGSLSLISIPEVGTLFSVKLSKPSL